MKKIKKILATLMMATLLIPTGISAVPVKAATTCNSPADVTRVLEDMAPIYRSKFWNAGLSSDAVQRAVDNGYSDPYRNIDMGERHRALGLTDNPGNTSNNFNGWTTCTGFARYVFYVLFGTKLPSYNTLIKNPAAYNVTVYSAADLKNGFTLQAGDFFYEHSPHAAVVSKNVNGKVHVVEANVNNSQYKPKTGEKYNNYINWDNPASNADGYWGYRYSYGSSHNNDTLVQTIINNDGYVVRHNFTGNSENTSTNPVQTEVASALSINGVSPIGTIMEGNTYPIDGTVTSNYTITDVTGTIYDANGNTVYTKSVNPGTASYKLKYSKVDNALLFNYLPAGSYIYKISASDSKGGYQENSQGFTVRSDNSEAEEEARAQAEAKAKAEAEAKAKAEAEAAAKENNTSANDQVIVMPDHENETVKVSGDTGEFDLHLGIRSSTESFTAASDRLTVITRGQVEDLISGNIRTDAGRHFSMNLYDVTDGSEQYVDGYYANCDNIEGGLEFNVQKGHQYRIRLETDGLSYREAVTGDGHVYPIGQPDSEDASDETEKAEDNTVYESDDSQSRSSDDQIIVMPDHENEDMSISGDTGKFDLHLGISSSTESFTAASDRLTIITRGQVEDLISGNIRTDASRHFSMYLYDVTDGSEQYVDGYYANCDNIEGGLEFDVQEGHQYRIRLDTDGLSYNEAVIGDGHAYPIR